jgi:hypothetical protein
VLEGPEPVEDERLSGGLRRSILLMEQEAMAPEAVREASDGGVGDAGLSGDLAKTGAGDEAVEDGLEEVASS